MKLLKSRFQRGQSIPQFVLWGCFIVVVVLIVLYRVSH